jgi:hypothetical protein
MPTIAQDWIEAAYAYSSANDPGKTAEDPEVLAILNGAYQAYYALAAVASPDTYQSRQTVTLAAGIGPLPPDVIDVIRVQNSAGSRVNVYPIRDLDRLWTRAPAIFREARNLVSRGDVGDPGPTAVLTVWMLDAPTTLDALSTPIDPRFAVRWHDLPTLDLALYLQTKDEGRDPTQYQKIKSAQDDLMKQFALVNRVSLTALQSVHTGAVAANFGADKA